MEIPSQKKHRPNAGNCIVCLFDGPFFKANKQININSTKLGWDEMSKIKSSGKQSFKVFFSFKFNWLVGWLVNDSLVNDILVQNFNSIILLPFFIFTNSSLNYILSVCRIQLLNIMLVMQALFRWQCSPFLVWISLSTAVPLSYCIFLWDP